MRKPIFGEPPDDLDATWRDGFLLGGICETTPIGRADAFKLAGDILAEAAPNYTDAYELVYPIFFNYRQSIELYLKIALQTDERTHILDRLLNALEGEYRDRHVQPLPVWFRERILEFDEFDRSATAFRYDDSINSRHEADKSERWIDLGNLRQVMEELQREFHRLIRETERGMA